MTEFPSFALLDYKVTDQIYLFVTRNTSSAKTWESSNARCDYLIG